MKLVRDLAEFPQALRGGAVSIGNFDGVHLGHASIVSKLITAARRVSGPAVVFTFDPHPVRLLRPAETPPPLTWTDRKAELLGELGVDCMVAYPTNQELLQLSADEFFEQIVRDQLAAQAMVEGPNFFFGRNREGTIERLEAMCQAARIELSVVQPVRAGEEFVSSSRVRRLLADGDVEQAAAMLTRPYRLRGMVTHGASRGTQLGFPTANVDAVDTIVPALGVYAGLAHTGGAPWPAAVNLGPNPTFGEDARKLEVHLIGWQGSLYGQPLEVDFLQRLRDIRRFDGVDELLVQLRRDVAQAHDVAVDYLQQSGRPQ